MIDFNKLKTLYKLGRNIGLEDVKMLLDASEKKNYEPGDIVIKEGSFNKRIYFINRGLVRAYVINDKGDEVTTGLRKEHQLFLSPDVVLFREASRHSFECLEASQVFSLNHEVLDRLVSQNPKLEANRKYITRTIIKEAFNRIDSFILRSPEERYLDFIDKNSDLMHRVPNKYIANVLGITEVSLSRIRRRIADRKR